MWSEPTGRKPTEDQKPPEIDEEDLKSLIAFTVVLDRAHKQPFTLQSDFARQASSYVAICACEGLISVRLEEDTWGDRWLITQEGLYAMENMKDAIKQFSRNQNPTD